MGRLCCYSHDPVSSDGTQHHAKESLTRVEFGEPTGELFW